MTGHKDPTTGGEDPDHLLGSRFRFSVVDRRHTQDEIERPRVCGYLLQAANAILETVGGHLRKDIHSDDIRVAQSTKVAGESAIPTSEVQDPRVTVLWQHPLDEGPLGVEPIIHSGQRGNQAMAALTAWMIIVAGHDGFPFPSRYPVPCETIAGVGDPSAMRLRGRDALTVRYSTRPRLSTLLVITPVVSSGALKSAGLGRILGFDLTLISAGLLGLMAIWVFLKHGLRLSVLLPLIGIPVALAISLGTHPTYTDYSTQKYHLFFLLTLPIMVATAVVIRDESDLWAMVYSWLTAAFIVCMIAVGTGLTATALSSAEQRTTLGVTGTAGTLGYYAGIGAVICVSLLMVDENLSKIRKGSLLVALLMFTWLSFGAASRGGLAAAVVALTLTVMLRPTRLPRLLPYAILAIPAMFALWGLAPAAAKQRLIFTDSSRLLAWSQTWEAIQDYLLQGIGSSELELVVSPIDHPHNLLLEMWAITGFFGFIAVLVAVIVGYKRAFAARHHALGVITAQILTFWLFGAMVSLDVNNRLLWIALVTTLALPTALGKRAALGQEPTGSTAMGDESRVVASQRVRGLRQSSSPTTHTPSSAGQWNPAVRNSP